MIYHLHYDHLGRAMDVEGSRRQITQAVRRFMAMHEAGTAHSASVFAIDGPNRENVTSEFLGTLTTAPRRDPIAGRR